MHEGKIKHNAALRNDSVNERTIRYWYANFETENESLKNEDWGRPETVVYNEVLLTIVEKNPGYTIKKYAEKLGVSPTIISHHLKLIVKVKKNR